MGTAVLVAAVTVYDFNFGPWPSTDSSRLVQLPPQVDPLRAVLQRTGFTLEVIGFDIFHNGVPRTFRDQKVTAYEAARFAKAHAKSERSSGLSIARPVPSSSCLRMVGRA